MLGEHRSGDRLIHRENLPFKKLYPDRPPRKRPAIPHAEEVNLKGRLFASPPEAAALLNCSLVTLERQRKSGGGPPFVRLSARRIGYPVKTLLDYKQGPEPAPAPAEREDA